MVAEENLLQFSNWMPTSLSSMGSLTCALLFDASKPFHIPKELDDGCRLNCSKLSSDFFLTLNLANINVRRFAGIN